MPRRHRGLAAVDVSHPARRSRVRRPALAPRGALAVATLLVGTGLAGCDGHETDVTAPSRVATTSAPSLPALSPLTGEPVRGSLPELAADLEGGGPSQPYLPFGPAEDRRPGPEATSVDAVFSSGTTTSWEFGDSGYRRTAGFAANGDDFVADSLLVMRVEIGDAGYKDPAGNPVPETELDGGGDAILFSAGTVTKGTWAKNGLTGAITLTADDGSMLEVPVGHTWIELVPVGDGGDVRWR